MMGEWCSKCSRRREVGQLWKERHNSGPRLRILESVLSIEDVSLIIFSIEMENDEEGLIIVVLGIQLVIHPMC